jgi:hypothetical protein
MTPLRQTLESNDSYATTLIVVLYDLFGTEFLGGGTAGQEPWAPETIRLEARDETGAEIPDHNMDKIMAGVTLLTTDLFYTRLSSFIDLCNVLADGEFNPELFDPATTAEMAWAITEAMLLDPPEDTESIFSDEIRRYIGEAAVNEALLVPPDVLQFAIIEPYNTDPAAEFSDDPEMYNAVWDSQRAKSDEVTQMLKRELMELFAQVSALPLRNGNAKNLQDRLRKAVRKRRAEDRDRKRWDF